MCVNVPQDHMSMFHRTTCSYVPYQCSSGPHVNVPQDHALMCSISMFLRTICQCSSGPRTRSCVPCQCSSGPRVNVPQDRVLINQWKDEIINGFKLSAQIMANMNKKVRNKYGADFVHSGVENMNTVVQRNSNGS